MPWSLVKRLFGGIFGGTPEATATAAAPAARSKGAGPYGLGLGLAADIDVSLLRLDQKSLAHAMPPGRIVVSGHGVVRLDSSGLLHRYYDDDHRMLQVVCKDSVANVQEVSYFQAWDEVVPVTDAEWESWEGEGGKMRAATYDADGIAFERAWGEPSTRSAPLVEFTEEVETDEGTKRLFQKTMSYRRRLPNGVTEMLLIISVRDLDSADRGSISFMIGHTLTPADVTPV